MSEVIDTVPQYKLKNPWAKDVFVLSQVGVPRGIAPTGTMAANGAVTLGTAFSLTYTNIWLYFPTNAVYAGSAEGFYYTEMSSTTAGTVYNDTYTPGSTSYDIPASPTSIVAAGPGAYTGVTSEVTALSVNISGGAMGKYGQLIYSNFVNGSSTANNKADLIKLNTTVVGGISNLTNNLGRLERVDIRNMGVTNRQHSTNWIGIGSSSSSGIISTIDTTATFQFKQTLQLTVATDYVIFAGGTLLLIPS